MCSATARFPVWDDTDRRVPSAAASVLCPRPRWHSHACAPAPPASSAGAPLRWGWRPSWAHQSCAAPSGLCFSWSSCSSRRPLGALAHPEGSVRGLSPPPTLWKLPELGGGKRGREGVPPGRSVCMDCLDSFSRAISRFPLFACSVCITSRTLGCSLVPPYPAVQPLVTLLCPPDEPHAVLSEPFLHPWGRRLLRTPCPAPGSAVSTGSPLLPRVARGAEARGWGWAIPAPGPLTHLSWETECACKLCAHVCNYRHTRVCPSLSPPGHAGASRPT